MAASDWAVWVLCEPKGEHALPHHFARASVCFRLGKGKQGWRGLGGCVFPHGKHCPQPVSYMNPSPKTLSCTYFHEMQPTGPPRTIAVAFERMARQSLIRPARRVPCTTWSRV